MMNKIHVCYNISELQLLSYSIVMLNIQNVLWGTVMFVVTCLLFRFV